MTALLEIKQHLKIFYSRYDVYLISGLKFLLALFAFFMINGEIGFMEKVTSPAISILLSLLCSFLPVNMIAIFGAILVCLHAFALSLEVLIVAAGLLFVMYAIYFRISPEYGYVLVVTPIAFFFKIPYALPLVLGLVGSPVCAVPVAFGTIGYYLMHYMKTNEKMLSSSEADTMVTRLTFLAENLINNKTVILTILVFAVTLVAVYVIHKMSIDYAWSIALGTGAVLNVVLFLIGALVMEVNISILSLVLGTIVALLIAIVVEFFVFSVDYSRVEYTQFEDDEYYYFVKAVPKMSIAVSEKRVKKINSRNKSNKKRR